MGELFIHSSDYFCGEMCSWWRENWNLYVVGHLGPPTLLHIFFHIFEIWFAFHALSFLQISFKSEPRFSRKTLPWCTSVGFFWGGMGRGWFRCHFHKRMLGKNNFLTNWQLEASSSLLRTTWTKSFGDRRITRLPGVCLTCCSSNLLSTLQQAKIENRQHPYVPVFSLEIGQEHAGTIWK